MSNRQSISTFLGIAAAVVLVSSSYAQDINCPADLDRDGTVDVLDLIDLLLLFGQPCPERESPRPVRGGG